MTDVTLVSEDHEDFLFDNEIYVDLWWLMTADWYPPIFFHRFFHRFSDAYADCDADVGADCDADAEQMNMQGYELFAYADAECWYLIEQMNI